MNTFDPYVWNNWSWGIHTMNTQFWHKKWVWQTFIEIDHDDTKNVIGMQYSTPRPWHVLIPWSTDHVISPSSLLVIHVFHIPIIIPMQALLPIDRANCRNLHIYSSLPCEFGPIIPPIMSSSYIYIIFSLDLFSKLWWKAQKDLENIPMSNWLKSLQCCCT
jgi:hypothetical protein